MQCWLYATVCALIGLTWQYLTVTANYGGNWTGLFCIGADRLLPPEFASYYHAAAAQGYDGQYYLLMAHDPWMTKGFSAFMDWPGLRYLRILEPALAWALPFSAPVAYVLVNLVFLEVGSAFTGLIAVRAGLSPLWTFSFLLLPAVWISLDRMTVDMAFVAVFVVVCYRPGWWPLAALCLVRETGYLAIAAVVGWHLWHRRWSAAGWASSAAVPGLLWGAWVALRFPIHFGHWVPTRTPFARTAEDVFTLMDARVPTGRVLEVLSLMALVAALLWTLRTIRSQPGAPLAAVFGLLGLYLFALGDWANVYDYGRVLSPMLAAMAIQGIVGGNWALLAPAALITARVGVQLLPQLKRITDIFILF